jgi:hypothetical protein
MLQPQTKVNSIIQLQIIWGAMLFSPFMMLMVLKIIYGGAESEQLNPELMKQWYLYFGLATASLVASYFIPRFLFSQAKQQKPTTVTEMVKLYSPGFIVSLALTEAVSIIGFMFSFIKNDPSPFYAFISLTVVVFLMRFPTEGKVKALFHS